MKIKIKNFRLDCQLHHVDAEFMQILLKMIWFNFMNNWWIDMHCWSRKENVVSVCFCFETWTASLCTWTWKDFGLHKKWTTLIGRETIVTACARAIVSEYNRTTDNLQPRANQKNTKILQRIILVLGEYIYTQLNNFFSRELFWATQ